MKKCTNKNKYWESRNLGRDIVVTLRNIAGGEIVEYTELLASSRDEATKRMIEKARAMGANATIGVKLATSNIMSGATEVVAYGTAVVLEKTLEGKILVL